MVAETKQLSALVALIAAMSYIAPVRGDPVKCREAMVHYNDVVAAIHAAVTDYRRCLNASRGHDDCVAEFIELQVTHRDYEAAVAEQQPKCGQ